MLKKQEMASQRCSNLMPLILVTGFTDTVPMIAFELGMEKLCFLLFYKLQHSFNEQQAEIFSFCEEFTAAKISDLLQRKDSWKAHTSNPHSVTTCSATIQS